VVTKVEYIDELLGLLKTSEGFHGFIKNSLIFQLRVRRTDSRAIDQLELM